MISIVVPAFNEARNVPQVVRDIAATFASIPEKRVIVVDDGSSDETAAVVRALLPAHPFLELVQHPHNMGLGAALKTGYGRAREGVAAWLPADGQFEARWILAFYETWQRTRCAIVVGNITAANRRSSDGWVRLAISKALRVLFFLRKKRQINFNGLMLFELARAPLERFHSTTGIVNFEILEHFEGSGDRIEFENITVRPRLSGESKVTNLRTYLAVLRDMVRK
jgi:dolichol-phosphate mannosyltransferase